MSYRFFSPFPKHLQIRELLLRRIEREFQPGDQFPTEQALATEFGVTRATIREALRWIEDEGLIRRHRGQGTFVTARPERPSDNRVTGMTEHFAQLNQDTWAEVVEKGVVPSPSEIAAALHRPPDEPVFRVTRVRHFEGGPLAYHECFVSLSYGARALDLTFEQSSLMKELEDAIGTSFREAHQRLEAIVADTGLATLLDISLGAPILVITRYYTADGNEPAIVFRSNYRADRYYYTVDLSPRVHGSIEGSPGGEGKMIPVVDARSPKLKKTL